MSSVPSTPSSAASPNVISVTKQVVVNENEITVTKHDNIIQCITDILADDTRLTSVIQKYDISIESIALIHVLLKDAPSLFYEISTEIYKVLEDNKFDSHDIPHVIRIIKDVVELNMGIIKGIHSFKTDVLIQFIRTLFIFMVETDHVCIPLMNKINIINTLDSSIHLLSTTLAVPKKSWRILKSFSLGCSSGAAISCITSVFTGMLMMR